MATSRPDRHIPDRRQYTNHGEHQYQSTYTNQNRSYNKNYNQNYKQIWENHSDRTCNNCGTKGHIARYCTKTSFWCQWCHTATHDTQACRSKASSSTPLESPSAGSYHPTQSPNQHNTSNHQPVPAHTTQPSPAPSGSEEWAKLLVTRMEEQEYNNREIGTDKMTPSETTEARTALGMTTQTPGRSTNTITMPENPGTTSSSSTV